MSVLIISATEMEILPFLKQFREAEVIITGVGAPMAIYSLTKKLFFRSYELVIQAGIAGTFDDKLVIGETLIVEKDKFADIGMTGKGKFVSVFESGLADGNEWPFQKEWLTNDGDLNRFCNLKKVNGITINNVSDILLPLNISLENTIETMEGAALHYVCLHEKVPFLQLRSISNKAGDRDKQNWNIELAVQNLNAELIMIYKNLM